MSDVSEASKEAMSIHEAVNHVFSKSWHLRSHPYIESTIILSDINLVHNHYYYDVLGILSLEDKIMLASTNILVCTILNSSGI